MVIEYIKHKFREFIYTLSISYKILLFIKEF